MTFILFLPETDDKTAHDPRAHTVEGEHPLKVPSKFYIHVCVRAHKHTYTYQKYGGGGEIQKPIRKINSQSWITPHLKPWVLFQRTGVQLLALLSITPVPKDPTLPSGP